MSGTGDTTDFSYGNGDPDKTAPATARERSAAAAYASQYFAGLQQAGRQYERSKHLAGQAYLRKLRR